ncbi:MAG TPA: SCO family protein [Longimicrobium sp.]|nr:SCO family protein [Longimicrobium sp.]
MKPRPPLLPMVLAILAVLCFTAAYAAWVARPPRPAFHGTAYDPAPAPAFRLADVEGRPVTLDSYRGTPVLIFFGYTKCADFCPLTLDRLSRTVHDLGRRAGGARIVFVSVDPANDTPPILRDYAARFGGNVTALTGDSAALAQAWKGYGVYALPEPEKKPSAAAAHGDHGHHANAPASSARTPQLMHSGVVYGIDRAGNLRVIITEGAPVESMRDDIRTLARL